MFPYTSCCAKSERAFDYALTLINVEIYGLISDVGRKPDTGRFQKRTTFSILLGKMTTFPVEMVFP